MNRTMIKVVIDGISVEVEKGATILEAAREAKVGNPYTLLASGPEVRRHVQGLFGRSYRPGGMGHQAGLRV